MSSATITPLPAFTPDLHHRAWLSVPHPTLPLLATAHSKSATVYSLTTNSSHSTLTGGHTRSVRSLAWKPNLPPHKLCLVSGSFDSTAGIWRWDEEAVHGEAGVSLEKEITSQSVTGPNGNDRGDGGPDGEEENEEQVKDWEFTLVLEGHDSEIKCATFSPSGVYLATSSRDKSIWIWEDIGATEADDEWETIAVLTEHEGDVKAVAWCPDVPGRNSRGGGVFGADCLASASYDDTVRIWREDGDGEWVCVAVLEGHEGTVWGVQWEGKSRRKPGGGGGAEGFEFPRLLSHSADGTIRIWTLKTEDEEEDAGDGTGNARGGAPGLGGIPNTMRRSLREEWICTDVLPQVHKRDIYSVAWSAQTGLVASTGSDGTIVLYREEEDENETAAGAAAGEEEDHSMVNGIDQASSPKSRWRVLTVYDNPHGPYEVNHITWCKRFDAGAGDRRGEEEMLVTTGDDGLVKPWQVGVSAP